MMVRDIKIEAPKPEELKGERSAQDVDNFIGKMEDYFEHVNIVNKAAKIPVTTMYLANTSKLWWRRKKPDMEKGICAIKDWEQLSPS